MFLVFSPGQALIFAAEMSFGGVVVIDAAVHHSGSQNPLFIIGAFGVAIELFALWVAITALRYICRGVALFLRGPQ